MQLPTSEVSSDPLLQLPRASQKCTSLKLSFSLSRHVPVHPTLLLLSLIPPPVHVSDGAMRPPAKQQDLAASTAACWRANCEQTRRLECTKWHLTQHCYLCAETVARAMGSEAHKIAHSEQEFQSKKEEYVHVAELLERQKAQFQHGMQQILGVGGESHWGDMEPSPAKSTSKIESSLPLDVESWGVNGDASEDDIEEIKVRDDAAADGNAASGLSERGGEGRTEDESMRTSHLSQLSNLEFESHSPLGGPEQNQAARFQDEKHQPAADELTASSWTSSTQVNQSRAWSQTASHSQTKAVDGRSSDASTSDFSPVLFGRRPLRRSLDTKIFSGLSVGTGALSHSDGKDGHVVPRGGEAMFDTRASASPHRSAESSGSLLGPRGVDTGFVSSALDYEPEGKSEVDGGEDWVVEQGGVDALHLNLEAREGEGGDAGEEVEKDELHGLASEMTSGRKSVDDDLENDEKQAKSHLSHVKRPLIDIKSHLGDVSSKLPLAGGWVDTLAAKVSQSVESLKKGELPLSFKKDPGTLKGRKSSLDSTERVFPASDRGLQMEDLPVIRTAEEVQAQLAKLSNVGVTKSFMMKEAAERKTAFTAVLDQLFHGHVAELRHQRDLGQSSQKRDTEKEALVERWKSTLTPRSLKIFSLDSRLRARAILLTENPWFDRFVQLTIVINIVWYCMGDPESTSGKNRGPYVSLMHAIRDTNALMHIRMHLLARCSRNNDELTITRTC